MDAGVLAEFGERVRSAREARGWTQEALAAKTGLVQEQISRVENGARDIRLTTLLLLIEALDVPPETLLNDLRVERP